MENFNEKQNEMFGKLFGEIKKQKPEAIYRSDALAMLKMNDENFIQLYKDTTEITGDKEDIELCWNRAKYLKIT